MQTIYKSYPSNNNPRKMHVQSNLDIVAVGGREKLLTLVSLTIETREESRVSQLSEQR